MKRIFFLFCSLVFLSVSVLAAPLETLADSPDQSGDQYIFYGFDDVASDAVIPFSSEIPSDAVITDVSLMSLSPISPEDTTGLKSIMLSLIGDYDPVIIEYQYESSNGYTNYLREVQPDYVWLCSMGLFAIVVYCVFRLGGALIRD